MLDFNMYVCGPTLYSDIHIGNARPIILFDVVAEYYRRIGRKVKYARNITDVDDKIISLCGGQHPGEWVKQNTLTRFRIHEQYLGTRAPDVEPFASDYIKNIIDMIIILIGEGFADFQVHGNESGIYFKTNVDLKYGNLSNRKSSGDFCLWKIIPDDIGEFTWMSPWGTGRPGWHSECAAMIKSIFNGPVDLHGGGNDLLFPHHENEDAQCRCAFGHSSAKKWMWNSHLLVENVKMGKSLNNFVLVKDLMKDWDGNVIRHMILKTNYNKPINFNFSDFKISERIVTKKPLAALPIDKEWTTEQMHYLSQNFNTAVSVMKC